MPKATNPDGQSDIDIDAALKRMYEEDMGLLPDEQVLRSLIAILADETYEENQTLAAEILCDGSCGPLLDDEKLRGEVLDALKGAASSSSALLRKEAFVAIGKVGTRKGSPLSELAIVWLSDGLSDPDQDAAEEAALAIWWFPWGTAPNEADIRKSLLARLRTDAPELSRAFLLALLKQREVAEVRVAVEEFSASSPEAARIARDAGYRRRRKPK